MSDVAGAAPPTQPDRLGAAVAAALGLLLVVLIAVWTPWDGGPGPIARPAGISEYFTVEQVARSDAFFAAARWPSWGGLLVSALAPVLVGLTAAGRRACRSLLRPGGRWWLQVPVLTAVVLVLVTLAGLPFDVWSSLVARDYGLVTQPWGSWAWEVVTHLALTWALTSLGLVVLVGAARRLRRWYVAVGLGAAAATVLLSLLYPYVVEPLSMSTQPMPASPLRTELLQMAHRDGVELSDVLVADASSRTTAQNAYVSGFGPSRRLVVYDNLLGGGSASEVRVIVAHELGHAKYDDVWHGTLVGATAAAAGVVLLGLLLARSGVRRRLRVDGAGDPRVVPAVVAIAAVATFAATPVVSTMSRAVERRADLHSLSLTRDPGTFISMQRGIAVSNLAHLDPNPVLAFCFSTHPDTMARIDAALAWNAAHPDAQVRR